MNPNKFKAFQANVTPSLFLGYPFYRSFINIHNQQTLKQVKNMTQDNHNTLGWFDGRIHYYPIHVFYEDTDFSGLVYHANYLRYFERGRSSFLKLIGVAHSELWQEHGIAFTIRKFEIDYKAPAKINDCLLYTSPSPRDRQKSRMPSSA